MMNYEQAVEWLYEATPQFQRIGAAAYKPGLDTARRLAEIYGNPQSRFKTIHIAGTNGKGSTAHSIAAILQSEGYKVGLYTSPHLIDFRERIRIDGEMIDRDSVADFVNRWRECGFDLSPSFFELTTIMAFDWFARSEIDIAVIETGLGGRLDTTNIISPILSVITNISKDHTAQLGKTLALIAAEKGGIIKPGIPVLVGNTDGEGVREVLADMAQANHAPFFTPADFPGVKLIGAKEGLRIYDSQRYGEIGYSLTGDYQDENIATVLAAIELLRTKCDIAVSDEAVKVGLVEVQALTGLAGRWMTLSEHPRIICDTGHNEGAWRQIGQTLDAMGDRLAMVIGFVNDKDVSTIMSMMPRRARYYFTQASVPRAMSVGRLSQIAGDNGLDGELFPDVQSAVNAAIAWATADPSRTVFVGGSTFVVADLLATHSR